MESYAVDESGTVRLNTSEPPCFLNDKNVIEFSRREIAATVGLDSGARFSLAGGAFKTLLTGHPPRDLDLWAASERDRELLVSALQRQKAHRLPDRPFADAFEHSGRVIEVPHKVAWTLREHFESFDLALSAIGAEHRPDNNWSAIIHPLAMQSIKQRKVLLLKPLANWKYALTTLERMRRYAHELSFESPVEEEEEIWRLFSAQLPETRDGMMRRYALTGSNGFGVAAEAKARG